MAWSSELKVKIGLQRAALLRKLTPNDGQVLLAPLNLSPEEMKEALAICKPAKREDSPQVIIYDPTRRTWFLAAWILGASWRQLASLHAIAHPSVAQSARKGMTQEIVDEKKRIGARMTLERLALLRNIYLDNKAELSALDPIPAAHKLDELSSGVEA